MSLDVAIVKKKCWQYGISAKTRGILKASDYHLVLDGRYRIKVLPETEEFKPVPKPEFDYVAEVKSYAGKTWVVFKTRKGKIVPKFLLNLMKVN